MKKSNDVGNKNYHNIAHSYWESCKNSYIGSEDLYIRQEEALIKFFIPKILESDNILDIACSNGRFTFVISKYCKFVDAFDLSNHLIKNAIDHASTHNLLNVKFSVQDVSKMDTNKKYNHIMCMGLFTAVIDDLVVEETVDKISKIIVKGGYLVVKDSLSTQEEKIYVNGAYAAIYRNESKYISLFESRGMSIENSIVLHQSTVLGQKISSKFIMFKIM